MEGNEERLFCLLALDERIINGNDFGREEIQMASPAIGPVSTSRGLESFIVFASRTTTPDPTILGLSLSLIASSGTGSEVHADFDLSSGKVVQVTFENQTADPLEISYDDDGNLVEGTLWQSRLAIQSIDQLLRDLCETLGAKQKPSQVML